MCAPACAQRNTRRLQRVLGGAAACTPRMGDLRSPLDGRSRRSASRAGQTAAVALLALAQLCSSAFLWIGATRTNTRQSMQKASNKMAPEAGGTHPALCLLHASS